METQVSSLVRNLVLLALLVLFVLGVGIAYQWWYGVPSTMNEGDSIEITREDKQRLVEQLNPKGTEPASEQELETRLEVLNSLNPVEVKGDTPQKTEPSKEEVQEKLNVLQSLHGAE